MCRGQLEAIAAPVALLHRFEGVALRPRPQLHLPAAEQVQRGGLSPATVAAPAAVPGPAAAVGAAGAAAGGLPSLPRLLRRLCLLRLLRLLRLLCLLCRMVGQLQHQPHPGRPLAAAEVPGGAGAAPARLPHTDVRQQGCLPAFSLWPRCRSSRGWLQSG